MYRILTPANTSNTYKTPKIAPHCPVRYRTVRDTMVNSYCANGFCKLLFVVDLKFCFTNNYKLDANSISNRPELDCTFPPHR